MYPSQTNLTKATKDTVHSPSEFKYDKDKNLYICSNDKELRYSNVDKNKMIKVYRASN